jgi:hypothetical protein
MHALGKIRYRISGQNLKFKLAETRLKELQGNITMIGRKHDRGQGKIILRNALGMTGRAEACTAEPLF